MLMINSKDMDIQIQDTDYIFIVKEWLDMTTKNNI